MLFIQRLHLYRFAMKKKQISKKEQITKEEVANKKQIPESIYSKNKLTYIVVSAKPNAKTSQIISIDEDSVGVSIAAAPKDGEANQELIQLMSYTLGIKKSGISLDKGSKSRHKVMVTEQLTPEEVYQIIKENME